MYTNIDITGNDKKFSYIILYEDSNNIETYTKSNIKQDNNIWYNDDNIIDCFDNYNFENSKFSSIILLIPDYCLDLYKQNIKYILTIKTWINGKELIFGEYIFDIYNTLAYKKSYKYNNTEYNEYIQFNIYNPFYIMYSDECAEFRKEYFGEIEKNNSNGSSLYFSLQPVELINDKYFKLNDYNGGGNSINFTIDKNDYLSLSLSIYNSNNSIKFQSKINFNKIYKNNLKEYLTETYNINDNDNIDLYYRIVVKDKDNIYKYYDNKNKYLSERNLKTTFNLEFNSWNEYKSGLEIVSSVDIKINDNLLMTVMSNPIILNQNLFRFLIINPTDTQIINYINLDNIDMINYNINITNEIKNEITKIDSPENTKANIINTVFYRVNNISNIIIHPDVTEIICINLDAYKSKVNSFIIQIEGVKFLEYGRNKSGVMFKIIGNNLPNKIKQGTYHVLSDEEVLITSGLYKYE